MTTVSSQGSPLVSEIDTDTIAITVTPINDAPLIDPIADQAILEGHPHASGGFKRRGCWAVERKPNRFKLFQRSAATR